MASEWVRALMNRQYPFYRSPLVRWTFALTGAFLTFYLSPLSPNDWRATPSLTWLHNVLPWPLLVGGFAVYTLCLVWGSTRSIIWADFLGLFMYLCELIALIVTAQPQAVNAWAMVSFALVCVFHLVAGKMAIFQRELPT